MCMPVMMRITGCKDDGDIAVAEDDGNNDEIAKEQETKTIHEAEVALTSEVDVEENHVFPTMPKEEGVLEKNSLRLLAPPPS